MYNRIIEKKIKRYLSIFGCVLLYGPKYSGKTYLGKKYSKSQYFLANENNNNLLKIYREKEILNGEYPRLIDEWQVVPEIWDKIRHIIDMTNDNRGLYILTGSSILYNKDKVFHSGAGRFGRIKLDTLAFCEKHKCFINFNNLLNNDNYDLSEIKLNNSNNILDFLISGGWPNLKKEDYFNDLSNQYIDSILSMNVKEHINLNYDGSISKKILTSIARLNTTQIKKSKILSDINEVLDIKTLDKYLNVYDSIFLIFDIHHWEINFRSKYKIISSPKTYLFDPSIGLNLLGINSKEQLLSDLNTYGIYFENLVIKDLKVFCENNNAELYFYRDNKGNEIDAIIHIPNGKWIPIEIKLGVSYEDAESIFKRMDYICSIVTSKQSNISNKPLFKLIITSAGYNYKINGDYVINFADLDLF